MNKIDEYIQKAHQMAKDKGWWDEKRSAKEAGILAISELVEALEDYRAGRGMDEVYYEGTKPCGIPIEMADFVIRIMDWMGSKKYCHRNNIVIVDESFPEILFELNQDITQAFSEDYCDRAFSEPINVVEKWFSLHGMSMFDAIDVKMAYNATRPYKHGKKC